MKKILGFLLLASTAYCLVACGNDATPPQPMSGKETEDALSKATPEQQIEWYQRSPMPPAEKAKKIAEIEEKYGIKAKPSNVPPGAGG